MDHFGIKDAFDIAIVALLLYYLYRIMKESGTLNIFFGVLAFIVVWVLTSQILELKLLGSILDQFMGIGLLVLVILFQDQIKRFLVELGDHKRWRFLKNLFRHDKGDSSSDRRKYVLPIVYACMNMSKTKTGALIVIRQEIPLESYEKSGDIIDADINSRLIENIFFKNSPLHDGAMIIASNWITSVGCILPVSHDMDIPKNLGLRHRAALGMSQETDAVCVIVSEETGGISVAKDGVITVRVSTQDLEHILSSSLTE